MFFKSIFFYIIISVSMFLAYSKSHCSAGERHVSAEKNRKSSMYKDMILIPAGDFIMGSDDRWPDEKPRHTRYLDAFYIDKFETTNEQYKQFVDATKRKRLPSHWAGSSYPKNLHNHPVVYVTWDDADSYCRWRGKQLPTEAQWEKAARGTDGRTYPWGNEFDPNKSNNPQKGSKGTEPVGSYENGKSPYGLYDMSGNVWEWTSSWYGPHPGNTEPSEEYGKKYKVVKGGSWYDCLFYGCGISAPTFNRGFFAKETLNAGFGFRCIINTKR